MTSSLAADTPVLAPSLAKEFPKTISEAVAASVPVSFSFLSEPTLLDDPVLEGGLTGMFSVMSFVGDHNWSFTMLVPRDTIEKMVLKFTGFEIPYESSDFADIVGELANVLAGEVVAQLDGRKIEARMCLPTVARGHDLEVLQPEGTPATRLGFACGEGKFSFKLMLARPTQSWHRRVTHHD